ncbi:MAG: hypothetical protein K6A32_04145 [Bacteroidales bacterium]|nr:hypothetical protein [Bacteroidales bacterium]
MAFSCSLNLIAQKANTKADDQECIVINQLNYDALKQRIKNLDHQLFFLRHNGQYGSPEYNLLSDSIGTLRRQAKAYKELLSMEREDTPVPVLVRNVPYDHEYYLVDADMKNVHLFNAGKFVRIGYTLDAAAVGCSILSGVFAILGEQVDEGYYGASYALAAGAVGFQVAGIVYHFKSGRELKMSAGRVAFAF